MVMRCLALLTEASFSNFVCILRQITEIVLMLAVSILISEWVDELISVSSGLSLTLVLAR